MLKVKKLKEDYSLSEKQAVELSQRVQELGKRCKRQEDEIEELMTKRDSLLKENVESKDQLCRKSMDKK